MAFEEEGWGGGGVVGGKERETEAERRKERGAAKTTAPCRESLSAGRTVITGHRLTGKNAEILRLLGCRPWVLDITTTPTSPSFSMGHGAAFQITAD